MIRFFVLQIFLGLTSSKYFFFCNRIKFTRYAKEGDIGFSFTMFEETLKRMYRQLKPNGQLYCLCPSVSLSSSKNNWKFFRFFFIISVLFTFFSDKEKYKWKYKKKPRNFENRHLKCMLATFAFHNLKLWYFTSIMPSKVHLLLLKLIN